MKKILCAACVAFFPGLAQAAIHPLTQGADWTEFRFDYFEQKVTGNGRSWLFPSLDGGESVTFVLDVAQDALLQVTDAWLSGDIFQVDIKNLADNTTWSRFTSTPDADGKVNGDRDTRADYTAALNDPHFSSGSWFLKAGKYEVTGFIHKQYKTYGSGAVRVTYAPVPLPTSFGLMLGAGAVLGGMAARRRGRASRKEI